MTSELTMIRDRLIDINKALTTKGASVEHDGMRVDEAACIDVARQVQAAIASTDKAIDAFLNRARSAPPAHYPPPAETALP